MEKDNCFFYTSKDWAKTISPKIGVYLKKKIIICDKTEENVFDNDYEQIGLPHKYRGNIYVRNNFFLFLK